MKIVLLSDAPPLENGGFGNSAVSFSLAKILSSEIKIILTRLHKRSNKKLPIAKGLDIPVYVYKDFSFLLGLRLISTTLRFALDTLMFMTQLRVLNKKIQESGASRIFALCGNDPFFMINAWLLKKATGLPLDLYMVDDIVASALMEKKVFRSKIFGLLEKIFINKFDRILLISRGYAEHLENKYNVASTLLPVPIRYPIFEYRPITGDDKSKTVVFSGSINELYLDAIRDLCEVIQAINLEHENSFRVLLIGRESIVSAKQKIGDFPFLDVSTALDNRDLIQKLANSDLCFLPYSHSCNPVIRIMVKTAFSCKISEYFASGRPILVYGPSDSSTYRYFVENRLSIIASNKQTLRDSLINHTSCNESHMIDEYQETVKRNHSPEALRAILQAINKAD